MSESAETAVVTTVLFLIAILNIAGNSLVCVIIVKNQEMRTTVNYLLMNLAIADMIVGVLLPPGYIFVNTVTHPDGVTGNVLCKLLTGGTWGWVGTSASVLSLVVIAVERYYAVVHPHGNKGRLSKRKIKVIIPCTWIFGIIMIIPWVLVANYSKELEECNDIWPEEWMRKAFNMAWILLVAFFPVSLMAALYIRVVYTLWFKRGGPSQQQGVMKVRKRVTLMVVTVSVIFGLCYLPWSSVNLVKIYHPSRTLRSWSSKCYIMILVNSAINPIVYCLINQQFRTKFKRMMSCTCRPAPNVLHPVRKPSDQMIELAVVSTNSTQ